MFINLLIPFIFLATYITGLVVMGYRAKGINPFSFKGIRNILALLNIIFIFILILSMPLGLKQNNPQDITGSFMLGGLILFALMQFLLITNNALADFISDKTKIFSIYFSKKFYMENSSCSVKLNTENSWKNIYCWENNRTNAKVCIIREIENTEDIFLFLNLFYENFSKNKDFDYKNFTDFAEKNGIFTKTYEVVIKKEEKKVPIETLLEKRGILTRVKKLNINSASEQEITNLPFINIITAKRILKHLNEEGQFKSFWEFANFAKINPNQGLILSKLVYTKEIPSEIQKNKDKLKREVDI